MNGAGSTRGGEQTPLEAILDTIVPADDYPSAGQAGGLGFLRALGRERPDWNVRIRAAAAAVERSSPGFAGLDQSSREAVLASLQDDPNCRWLCEIVNAGYYADPGNGANPDGASWTMLGWQPQPAEGWPAATPREPEPIPAVSPGRVAERYDTIVIGSGAGGGVAAAVLAESGRTVLVVEAGAWPDQADLGHDHLRNPRSTWGLEARSGPTGPDPLRVVGRQGEDVLVRPGDPRWSGNAATAGGGTRVYGAQAWRFSPIDFAMATTYGVPPGSALADWPISYDELEPFYTRAEVELGVCGSAATRPPQGHRSQPYPMPPLPAGPTHERLAAAARTLGWSTTAVPLLINSASYQGRPGCARCRTCVGFSCPVDAKNGSQNTVLRRAFATGRCEISLGTTAARLHTDPRGRVTGVELWGHTSNGVWSRTVLAEQVVLAAGAIETARLLLNSPTHREPAGIGNSAGLVGRHLQGHLYGGATGVFDEVVDDLLGPGPSIATTDFQHHNPDVVGGGIIVNEFVPTPSNTYRYLIDAGLLPRFGVAAKRGMARLSCRMLRVMGPIQEVTSAESRVQIDPHRRDRLGIPLVRLSGDLHPEDLRGRALLSGRAAVWLDAAGATSTVRMDGVPRGPSGGQHQAGTCRMGTDPATSVVDPEGRVWGHPNLAIADASVHPTNGGVNPVLTVFALAYRTATLMAAQ